MCGGAGNNGTDAFGHDVVPPAALAAALIMVSAGVALVVVYGCNKKRAWKTEKTYVMHDQPRSGAIDEIPLHDMAEAEPRPASVEDDGVEGLDNGLSATLMTSLIPENT